MRGLSPLARVLPNSAERNARIALKGAVIKAQNSKACLFQPFVPQGVFGFSQPMHPAIELDDEFQLRAQEINDEARQRRLTPELQAIHGPPPHH